LSDRYPQNFGFYDRGGPINLIRTPLRIWSSTGINDLGGNFMFIPNVQQLAGSFSGSLPTLASYTAFSGGENGLVGERVWFYDYLDVRFSVTKNNSLPNAGNFTTFLRVSFVTARTANTSHTDFITNYSGAAGYQKPILTKDWKIRLDKVYPFQTGLGNVVAAPDRTINGQMSTGKNFRMRIPFRYRACINLPNLTTWSPPLNSHLFLQTSDDSILEVRDIIVTYYYSFPKRG